MNVEVVEEKKNKIVLQLKDQTNTLGMILKEELCNDPHVKIAGYTKRHPLVGIPTIIVETDGEEPRKVIQHAVQRLLRECEKFGKEIQELR